MAGLFCHAASSNVYCLVIAIVKFLKKMILNGACHVLVVFDLVLYIPINNFKE